MGKVNLVIKREFFNRVKKPGFLAFALLTPLVIIALALAPMVINKSNFTKTTIKVFDQTGIIGDIIAKHDQNKYVQYQVQKKDADLDLAIEQFDEDDQVMVLRIPENFIKNQAPVVELFNKNSPGIYIVSKIKGDLFDIRKKLLVYSSFKLDLQAFEEKMNSPVALVFQGQGMNPQMQYYLGLIFIVLLLVLIVMYGVQVMKGVQEEKSSRIMEVIISSVPAKQFLRGKIMGIGLAGLLQFSLVFLFAVLGLFIVSSYFEVDTNELISQQLQMMDTGEASSAGNNFAQGNLFEKQIQLYIHDVIVYLPSILVVLPFFFVLGYFLYASVFAAFGCAMNSESDIQNYIIPIILPLLLSAIIGINALTNPHGDLAFWGSIIPFSSPVVMPARLAYINWSTDWWQVALSASLLILGVVYFINMSGRIYKTGILLFGQKPSIRTLWKWFKESN